MNIERRASKLVAVEEDLEREVSLVCEGEGSRVRSVAVIRSFDRDGSVRGLDEELITAEVFVVTVLVTGLDGESEVFESSVFGISAGFDFEMERSIFNVFAFERDMDIERSRFICSI